MSYLFSQYNVLVSPSKEPLITDFGISKLENPSSSGSSPLGFSSDTLRGSIRWMACELLIGPSQIDETEMTYSKDSDIWAFGMVIYVSGVIVACPGILSKFVAGIADASTTLSKYGRAAGSSGNHGIHTTWSTGRS